MPRLDRVGISPGIICFGCILLVSSLLGPLPVLAQITFTTTGCGGFDTAVSVAVGDFNRDGKPDLAFASSNAVLICMNQGAGQFVPTIALSEISPNIVRTADVDNDGKLDLVVAEFGATRLSILFGAGDGNFTGAGKLSVSNKVVDFVVGNFTSDKAVDIVTNECDVSATHTCAANEYLNNGAGRFSFKRKLFGPTTDLCCLAKGDFNIDGNIDVIVGRRTHGSLVFLGKRDGTFAAPYSIFAANGLAVGSFNHDNAPDLVTQQPAPCSGSLCLSYAKVYLNDGNGHFGLRSRTLMVGPNFLATDINGDGIEDLVSVRGGHFDGGLDNALGHGNGFFSSAVDIGAADTPSLAIARDVNVDGRHDLVFPEFIPGAVEVLLNNDASVICKPPNSSSLAAKICSPLPAANLPSTFTVRGSGNSPAGLQRIELWVDGHKKLEKPEDQIKAQVSAALGTHRVAIVAVDVFGKAISKAITVTVQ